MSVPAGPVGSLTDKDWDDMSAGREFETPNGELPDDKARALAATFRVFGGTMQKLADGTEVAARDVYDEVVDIGRREGWPYPMEYLATWAANYGKQEQ